MIYDVFMYNGETDILEIRLNTLKNFADQFILIESPLTFSGRTKAPYFPIQRERFRDFNIKYFEIDESDSKLWDMARGSPNTHGAEHWKREFVQKESIKKALVDLKDEDIVFISDCDEIWNPEVLKEFNDGIYRVRQKVYVYYLNQRSNEEWTGTLLTRYKNIKDACLNHLRTTIHPIIGSGWHFTSMGGLTEVQRKLNDSYTEESYNREADRNKLAERWGKEDWFGRDFRFWLDESDWPEYLRLNKDKYAQMLSNNPVL